MVRGFHDVMTAFSFGIVGAWYCVRIGVGFLESYVPKTTVV